MKFMLPGLMFLMLIASQADAAKKKKAAESPPPAPVRYLTTYYCTIWHEITYDSAAAPILAPVGRVPVPHMGNVSLTKETGMRIPRPVDLWDEEDDHEHDATDAHPFVKAPHDTGVAASDTTGDYVLHWTDPKAGKIKYEFLTIREDHKGPVKPFFAGMGGNLYIGTCDE